MDMLGAEEYGMEEDGTDADKLMFLNPETESTKAFLDRKNNDPELSSFIDFSKSIPFSDEQITEEPKIKEIKLKDGKIYSTAEINYEMLKNMNYNLIEIGKILKLIC